MSAAAEPTRTPDADNVPGGASCPDWLLLLDDPSPRRVLLVGEPAQGTVEWFGARASIVTCEPAVPTTPPTMLHDLVVVDDPRGPVSPDPSDLERLARCCHDRGELRLPWHPTAALRRGLEAVGFPSVRTEVGPSPGRRRPARLRGLVAGQRPVGSVPAWLERTAATVGLPLDPSGWSVEVPADYPSRKAIARLPGRFPGTGAVVKVTRHPRFNARLQNEARRLAEAKVLGPEVTSAIPTVLASAPLAGLAMVVESTVPGRPFLEASTLRPGCPLARSAAEWTTRLAVASARPSRGAALGERLGDVLDRFEHRFAPPAATSRFLRDQVDRIAGSSLPGVLVHGDLGTWNLLADHGEVGVLDWESAEWPGPPLWDLLYFTRSFAVRSGRRRGLRRHQAIRRHLVAGSRLNTVAAGWVRTYAEALDLDRDLIAPLFHTCWMHRAVKESSLLPPGADGHYGPLCMRLADSRDAPGVRALVGVARTA